MALFTLLDTRRISGKGVLKVPSEALIYRYYILYIDLLRVPANRYASFQWNPPKSQYARLAFRRDGYVTGTDYVEFEKQQFTYLNDPAGQALIAIKCAYAGILQSFVNLVGGLGGTPGGIGIFVTGVTNFTEPMTPVALGWDEILFNCYSSTALLVRFYGTDYEQCGDLENPVNRPPAPPPPLFPPLSPDAVINDLSPPYDSNTNDDGNTQPYEGDTEDEDSAPLGEQCVLYDVVFRVTSPGLADGGVLDVPLTIYGVIDDYGVSTDGFSYSAYYVFYGNESTGCLEVPQTGILTNVSVPEITVEILSFSEH